MTTNMRSQVESSTKQQTDRRAFLATIGRSALATPIVTTLIVAADVMPAHAGSPYGGGGGHAFGWGRGGGGGSWRGGKGHGNKGRGGGSSHAGSDHRGKGGGKGKGKG